MLEDTRQPQEDPRWDGLHKTVYDYDIDSLAREIESYGWDDRAKDTIIEHAFPKNGLCLLMKEIIYRSNLNVLLDITPEDVVDKVRDMFIDKLYWAEA